jgi:hypothetical protein
MTGLALGGLTLALGRLTRLRSADPRLDAVTRLRRLADCPMDARPIGTAYLARFGDEASASRLATLILSSLSLSEDELARRNDQTLRADLASLWRRDFEHGQTTEIGGWILSRNEARLCALSALTL